MDRMQQRVIHALAVVACWLPGAPAAEPIYKWEGADGSMHYSESPPAAETGLEYQVLELSPPPASAPTPTGDYRAVIEVADSLQSARLQREQLRLQREQAALEQERLRQQARQDADQADGAATWLVFPRHFRPHQGPGRHLQPHPGQPRIRQPDSTPSESPPTGRVIVDH